MRGGRMRDRFPIELPTVLGLASKTHADYVVASEQAWAELPPSIDRVDAGTLRATAMARG
jgi:hypothetical protein